MIIKSLMSLLYYVSVTCQSQKQLISKIYLLFCDRVKTFLFFLIFDYYFHYLLKKSFIIISNIDIESELTLLINIC